MAAISTLKMLKMMKQKMMMLGKVDLDVFNTCSSNPTRTALLPFLVTCSYIWGKVRLKCKFGFHYTVHTFCRNLNLYTEVTEAEKTLEVQTMHVTSLQFTASSRVSRHLTSPPKAWRIVAANGWEDGKIYASKYASSTKRQRFANKRFLGESAQQAPKNQTIVFFVDPARWFAEKCDSKQNPGFLFLKKMEKYSIISIYIYRKKHGDAWLSWALTQKKLCRWKFVSYEETHTSRILQPIQRASSQN